MLYSPLQMSFAEPTKKILYINSYHQGDQWGDGISRGIESRLLIEDVALETYYMDSKRRRNIDDIKRVSNELKDLIADKKPDLVITSDDNAVKHLLVPFYKNTDLLFVFCGVNWDASIYGLPVKNVTGMLETSFITSIVDLLSQYTPGKKLGFLSIDAYSEHRSLDYYNATLDQKINKAYFVNSAQEWQAKFLALQNEVDMMILENPEGVEGWDHGKAVTFIQENTRIPVGSAYSWLAPLSLITIAKKPEEQGWWAAEQAMQLLAGKKPSDILIARNKEGRLFANLKIANMLGVTLPIEVLQTATIIKK